MKRADVANSTLNTLKRGSIFQDIILILAGILVAIVLVRTGVVIKVLASSKELEMLGSFIAGMFFTSVFTTTPAIIALGEIAHENSILLVASFGAFGAVVGDLIIFRFIRDRLSTHLFELVSHRGIRRRLRVLFKMRYFRWFTFLLGGMIIASPLPDELGVGLLGFTKLRLWWFIPVSFTFNFLGIVLIGLVAKTF